MISGLVTTIASMPVDIAKTRIQNMTMIDGKPEYSGAMVSDNHLWNACRINNNGKLDCISCDPFERGSHREKSIHGSAMTLLVSLACGDLLTLLLSKSKIRHLYEAVRRYQLRSVAWGKDWTKVLSSLIKPLRGVYRLIKKRSRRTFCEKQTTSLLKWHVINLRMKLCASKRKMLWWGESVVMWRTRCDVEKVL